MARKSSPHIRFWKYASKRGADDCWNWSGSKLRSGYGQMTIQGKCVQAHRFSYELHFGFFPKTAHVLHRCDNSSCVNPAHLFLGTAKDNKEDCVAKHRHAAGESHGMALLTREQVGEIRTRYVKRKVPMKFFADKFGVTISAVNQVLRNVTWKE